MLWNPRMRGDLVQGGRTMGRAGFWLGEPADPINFGPNAPFIPRGSALSAETEALMERMQRYDLPSDIQRTDVLGDFKSLQNQLGMAMQDIRRALTTATTAFPMRENLEAPARVLTPLQTPMRNRIPRVPGAGNAASWRQLSTVGGGYGFATTATITANSTTLTVASTAGMRVGDVLQLVVANGSAITGTVTVTVVVSATVLTVTPAANVTNGDLVVNTSFPAGAGTMTGITTAYSGRFFFSETISGSTAPAEKTETYVAKSLAYKQLGVFGSITGRAMASGATYQNQLAAARTNSIRAMMLNEENAIINGSSTSLLPPWGDFTNALGYDGLFNLAVTANGMPASHASVSVGPLTLSHIDSQFNKIWDQGGEGLWMLCSNVEAASLTHLAEAAGSIIRLQATTQGQAVLGLKVSGYVHPSSGEIAEIIISRYVKPGSILFGADRLPDGTNSLEMDVLPQAELPQLAPDEMIQGYTLQELAPTVANPLNYPWVIYAFAVLKMMGATTFATSHGVSAV